MTTPRYRPAGFFMLRAATLPVTSVSDVLGDDPDRVPARLRDWAARPLPSRGLALATRSLHTVLIQSSPATGRRANRLTAGLLRYLVRMASRPTPFGLFAGVAFGTFTNGSDVRLGEDVIARTRTRLDMGWLMSVVQEVEREPGLRDRLPMMRNALAYLAGDRLVLPMADVYGQEDYRMVQLTATEPVRRAWALARSSATLDELRASMCAAYPDVPAERVGALVDKLWEGGFLLGALRPPPTEADPVAFVLDRLAVIPGAEDWCTRLAELRTRARRLDEPHLGRVALSQLTALTTELRAIAPVRAPLHTDAVLTTPACQLPTAVAEGIAEGVDVLVRLSADHGYPAHLRAYVSAFIERYGPSAEVPLVELLSAESGLDAPNGYTQPARCGPPHPGSGQPGGSALERLLTGLLAKALRNGDREIELTDALVDRVAGQKRCHDRAAPPSLDVFVQVAAADSDSIARGEWRAVVGPVGLRPGGCGYGRFFDVLGDDAVRALNALARREEACHPDLVLAELCYLPTSGKRGNVAGRPAVRGYQIPVNVAASVPPDRVIGLDDIVVGLRGDRFYLRSMRLGRELVAVQGNMVRPWRAPNACRFLLEVSWARWAEYRQVSWGPLEGAPFLPRLVNRNVVLRPAQWNLSRESLSGDAGESFPVALARWRKRWDVDRWVYLTDGDYRLLIDLDRPELVAELDRELSRLPADRWLRLEEATPAPDEMWVRDGTGRPYATELIVTVETGQPTPAPVTATATTAADSRPAAVTMASRRQWPGGEWVYLKLYAPADRHDGLITEPVRDLVTDLDAGGLIDRWFFVRYSAGGPQLRLRLHATTPAATAALTATSLTWAHDLAESGRITDVALEPYDREIERYGGPNLIDSAERLFTADSRLVTALLRAEWDGELAVPRLVAAVVTLDRLADEWGLDTEERMRFALRKAGATAGGDEFRAHGRTLWAVRGSAHQRTGRGAGYDRTVLAGIADLWTSAARSARSAHDTVDRTWIDADTVFGSFAHLHANRLGFNRNDEYALYGLWRRHLYSARHRTGQSAGPSSPRGETEHQ